MNVRIGGTAPDFGADAMVGSVKFHDWAGDACVFFFSQPADFTPLCVTEMGRRSQLSDHFAAHYAKALGSSNDTVAEYLKSVADVNEMQSTTLAFPLVGDPNLVVAKPCKMIPPAQRGTEAVRAVFDLDPDEKIGVTMTYPMSVGRNFDEILSVIDVPQAGDRNRIATPADWRPGNEGISPPSTADDEAKNRFPKDWTTIKPDLHATRIPDRNN